MTEVEKKFDAYSIYELGIYLGHLDSDIYADKVTWDEVKTDLQDICSHCRAIKDFESIRSDAQSELSSLSRKYKSPSRLLKSTDLATLGSLVNNWFGRLDEISKKWVIILPETKLDIHKLTSGAKALFSDEEWKSLSELEQRGLDEAASCLLTNNFTASEFMALRTVESVLRKWYEKKTGKIIEYIAWGSILETLDKEFPEHERPKEISSLFHLKRRRNSIAHPDAISDEVDANVTFVYVIDVCKAVTKLSP
jgi:hypothetical protein